jgi:hypothetical protein
VSDLYWRLPHPKRYSHRTNKKTKAEMNSQAVQSQDKAKAAKNFDYGWQFHGIKNPGVRSQESEESRKRYTINRYRVSNILNP